jgi:hypothetical protein
VNGGVRREEAALLKMDKGKVPRGDMEVKVARDERKGRSSTVAGTWWGVALTCGPWHGGKRERVANEQAPLRILNFKGFFQTRKVNEFEIRNKIAPVL